MQVQVKNQSLDFEQACVFTLDTCRELNRQPEERRDAYQINHVSLNHNSIGAASRHQSPSARTLPPSTVRCFKTFCRSQKAFDNLSPRQGRSKPGHRRFKGKGSSIRLSPSPQSGFRLKATNLHLRQIGSCRVRLSRPIEGTIKTAQSNEKTMAGMSCLPLNAINPAIPKTGKATRDRPRD
ncbi:MAG: hypothetical protein IPL01_11435 [Acidobacteria bacterium]|nr:hypothetical protein [Acidobacteriota bacterium]